jgi:hypothetical protein
MTDAVEIAIIAALSGVPTMVGAIAAGWFSYKSAIHSRESLDVAKQTQKNTNGMKDQLVALTEKSSFAEGKLAGEHSLTVEKSRSDVPQEPNEANP